MYNIDNRQRTRVANVIRVNFNIKPHWYNVKGIVETRRGVSLLLQLTFFTHHFIITHKAQKRILRIP